MEQMGFRSEGPPFNSRARKGVVETGYVYEARRADTAHCMEVPHGRKAPKHVGPFRLEHVES
jgi:hypothetical protein